MTLLDTSSDLLIREVRLLRNCVAIARKQWDFQLDAAVVLPFQIQLLAVFNTGEFGVRQAMTLIRETFERHVDAEHDIWEQADDFTCLEWEAVPLRRAFIEAAPVRLGLVRAPGDWAYSSAQGSVPQAQPLGAAVA